MSGSLRVTFSRSLCTKAEKTSLFEKMSFIGGGKMAEAFISALHKSSLQNMSKYWR